MPVVEGPGDGGLGEGGTAVGGSVELGPGFVGSGAALFVERSDGDPVGLGLTVPGDADGEGERIVDGAVASQPLS